MRQLQAEQRSQRRQRREQQMIEEMRQRMIAELRERHRQQRIQAEQQLLDHIRQNMVAEPRLEPVRIGPPQQQQQPQNNPAQQRPPPALPPENSALTDAEFDAMRNNNRIVINRDLPSFECHICYDTFRSYIAYTNCAHGACFECFARNSALRRSCQDCRVEIWIDIEGRPHPIPFWHLQFL